MNDLILALKEGPIFSKALFVMAVGMFGVFIVLVVFYVCIKVLERAFRTKRGEESGEEA